MTYGLVVVVCCYAAGMVMALPYVDSKGYWQHATAYSFVVLFSVVAMIWGLS